MLATISGLTGVDTSGNGKYAQAYATELADMSILMMSLPQFKQPSRPETPIQLMPRSSQARAFLLMGKIVAIAHLWGCQMGLVTP